VLVHECVSAMAAAVLHMLGPHEPLSIDAGFVPYQLSATTLLARNRTNATHLAGFESRAPR